MSIEAKCKNTLLTTHKRISQLSKLITQDLQALGPNARFEPTYLKDIRSHLAQIAADLIALKQEK